VEIRGRCEVACRIAAKGTIRSTDRYRVTCVPELKEEKLKNRFLLTESVQCSTCSMCMERLCCVVQGRNQCVLCVCKIKKKELRVLRLLRSRSR